MKNPEKRKTPFLFGQVRKGETQEEFTERVLKTLRQSGLINEDGTNNLGKVEKRGEN